MRTIEEIRADRVQQGTSAPAMATLAEEMAALGTPEATAEASLMRGEAYSLVGDHRKALEVFLQALEAFIQLGDRTQTAVLQKHIGGTYSLVGMLSEALEYLLRAVEAFENLGQRDQLASAINITGSVYRRIGEYPTAVEYCKRSLEIYEDLGLSSGAAGVLAALGTISYEMDDHDRALSYSSRAVETLLASGHRFDAAIVTANLATVYSSRNDMSRAIDNYEQSRSIHRELGNTEGLAYATVNLAHTFLKLDRSVEAASLLKEVPYTELDDPSLTSMYHRVNARVYELNGDVEAAYRELELALSDVVSAGMRMEAAECHIRLRDLAKTRNDFAGYINHNDEYHRIKEEVRSKEATQRIAVMEAERKFAVERQEREKERALLYGALPEHIATRMLAGESIEDHFENAAVLFADIAGFTTHTSSMDPSETIKLLEDLYKTFDAICAEHGVIKVKTIGDSYLCFAHQSGEGLSAEGLEAAQRVANVALKMLTSGHTWPDGSPLQLRIGIHSGAVSAGVIGTQRLQYDIWGDTVNVASRMESTGEAGKVQVSEVFAQLVANRYTLDARGEVNIKGKGSMTTYWLEST